MTFTYTWKLTGIKKTSSPSASLTDVIVGTQWKLTGTDSDDVSGEFSGATPFDLNTINPDHFTAYEDLTEEMVLDWIKAIVVGSYKTHIDEQIQKQIDSKKNPIVDVNDGAFPWSPPSANTPSANTP